MDSGILQEGFKVNKIKNISIQKLFDASQISDLKDLSEINQSNQIAEL